MDQAISGFPPNSRIFLSFKPFEPALAVMIHRTLNRITFEVG
jgi:hypothetical protein